MLKSVLAPYTDLKLMPTGGINAGNVNSYLNIEREICRHLDGADKSEQ